jgi:sugar phosphate isomerase/epimerase
LAIGFAWSIFCSAAPAVRAGASDAAMPNPFYAYCVGIGVGKESATLPAQLELPPMLAELGYAGMAYVGLNGAPEMLQALEKHGQKLFAVYTPVNVDPGDRGYDPQVMELIPKLAGHGTLVWLVINSKQYKPSTTDGDQRAVELLRQLADAAQQHGVGLSLYPHLGCYAQRMEDVVRLVKKTERPNVGVTFTFCHFLAVDDAGNIDHALTMARPYLNMVTINGTNGFDPKNRSGWIRTLDEGSFDLSTVLVTLRKLDYRGPIGIIAYGIQGDRREILARSIKGWREISAKAAAAAGPSPPGK